MNVRDIIKLAAQLYVCDESCQALGILVDLNKSV